MEEYNALWQERRKEKKKSLDTAENAMKQTIKSSLETFKTIIEKNKSGYWYENWLINW